MCVETVVYPGSRGGSPGVQAGEQAALRCLEKRNGRPHGEPILSPEAPREPSGVRVQGTAEGFADADTNVAVDFFRSGKGHAPSGRSPGGRPAVLTSCGGVAALEKILVLRGDEDVKSSMSRGI